MTSAGGMHAGSFVISKADPRYWVRRLVKWHNAPNYGVQIQFRGRRLHLPCELQTKIPRQSGRPGSIRISSTSVSRRHSPDTVLR